jgi:hypothetical protein
VGYDPDADAPQALARLSMRIVKKVAAAGAVLVLLALVIEVAFRVGGLWVRGTPHRASDGRTVVLCVGDSHTRGRDDPDNYPFQLEQMLNERTGRRYRVINVGIPGQNTAQIRNRFERYLAYYAPAVVLHFGGVNNSWNEVETATRHPGLAARLAEQSRILRFIRVAVFYRRLSRATLEQPTLKLTEWSELERARYRVNFGGVEEDIRTDAGPHGKLPDAELERVTHDDLAAMMRLARERRVPMYLVLYPIRNPALVFEPVNRAIVRVSSEFAVPYVDSAAAAQALGPRPVEELYDTWAHPTPILYRQIAEEAYRLLVRQGVVQAKPGAAPPSAGPHAAPAG